MWRGGPATEVGEFWWVAGDVHHGLKTGGMGVSRQRSISWVFILALGERQRWNISYFLESGGGSIDIPFSSLTPISNMSVQARRV